MLSLRVGDVCNIQAAAAAAAHEDVKFQSFAA
jgi:hypothetical protein